MVSVCVACHQLLPVLILLTLLISVFLNNVFTLLVYDFQSLLTIRATVDGQYHMAPGGEDYRVPPVVETVPLFLCRYPPSLPLRKKSYRRRGKRGGILVKLRNCVATYTAASDIKLFISWNRHPFPIPGSIPEKISSIPGKISSFHGILPHVFAGVKWITRIFTLWIDHSSPR